MPDPDDTTPEREPRAGDRGDAVPHMSGAEFRALGRRMVDWVADYWERVEGLPVLSRVAPGDVLAGLPTAPPEAALAGWDEVFADLERTILPGITHWQSPNYFAYFSANASGPAVLGELLSAGLGVQGMLWATSPACTELETRVMDWLGGMVGLPGAFLSTSEGGGGVIQGTGSDSALVSLLAARERALSRFAGRDRRAAMARLVAYTSNQAHSSIVKAAMIAGIAQGPGDDDAVRLIGVDAECSMRPALLEGAIRADLRDGLIPFYVNATVGTTGTTAIDPLGAVADAAAAGSAGGGLPWLHVDAAHAGAACVCPEFRAWIAGVDRYDSFYFNPHKWLLTNFDCSAFWTRDRRTLTRALSVTPEYLRNEASESGAVIDYRDWQVPLGRRFRALKLWFVIRHYGVEGLRAYIREHVRLAGAFESWVRADPRFEVPVGRTMNLVCFRLRGRPGEAAGAIDARTKALMDAANATGRVYLTHTALPAREGAAADEPRIVLRMNVGSTPTRERHVRAAWELLGSLA